MSKSERHHDLDALRSTMLLLGLVIHASEAFFPNELRNPALWFFYDATSSSLAAPLSGAIHVYRMPVFFVLAGFFAAMLVAKRGISGLVANRLKRVAAPLVVALVMIVPLIYVAATYANSVQVGTSHFRFRGFDGVLSNKLFHLWFLWYLLIFYVATVAFSWASQRAQRWSRRIKSWHQHFFKTVDGLVNSNWAVPIVAVISLPFLAQMQSHPGCLDTTFDVVPPWHVLGIYGICYGYGWLLFRNRSRLTTLGQHAKLRMTVGVVAIAAYLGTLGWYMGSSQPTWAAWLLIGLSTVAIWSMVEAWLALFQRYFNRPSKVSRYLSDASYWVYLIHVPVMLVCLGWLANANVAAELKFVLAMAITTTMCLASYHLMVRGTFIGQFLNGRKYPIGIGSVPKARTATSQLPAITSELQDAA